jgi:hypothetical protein
MNARHAFLIATILGVFHACSESPTDSIPRGAFSYASYDSLGTQLAKGWLALNIADSAHISGEWYFTNVGAPGSNDSHAGSGILAGGTNNGETVVNLNPSFVDNNLILIGRLTESHYSGNWQWITFAGVSNHGTFEAHRQ